MSTFGEATNLCTSLRRRLVAVVVVVVIAPWFSSLCSFSDFRFRNQRRSLSGAPCVFACRNFNKIDKTMRIHVHSVLTRSLVRLLVRPFCSPSSFQILPLCARLVLYLLPFRFSLLYMCIYIFVCMYVCVCIFFTI